MEFVPASGAATRMFKGLTAVLNRTDSPSFADLAKEAEKNPDARETVEWFNGLRRFPFFDALAAAVAKNAKDADGKKNTGAGKDAAALYAAGEYRSFLEAMLSPEGLHFAHRPKALIPFHRYPGGPRTSLEEHLAEASALVKDASGTARMHFTVSPDHERDIRALLDAARPDFEAAGIRFEIGLSTQKASTDTLAADEHNDPLRNPDGSLCFRPGGHGALLENLFLTRGDIVFIKNIDNVVPDRLRPAVLAQRMALGGHLVATQDRISDFLDRLRKLGNRGDTLQSGHAAPVVLAAMAALVAETARFAEENLGISFPESLRHPSADARALAAKADFLIKALDRPLRVCAMVRNQGEPGGGPFWVRAQDGALSLQIVESAQIDAADPAQRAIAASATHFNPVDLVCGLRDRDGKPYPLPDFVDAEACFITTKSKDGQTVKALELPGLWNGSMAFWNTVFVETPIETFNPVKTVNDLLRPNHQG